MKSTSETGHAKNIANLNLLICNITALGTIYKPSNSKIQLSNLQDIYSNALSQQENVNNLVAPYSLAVDAREAIFKPLNRDLSKLRKAYKSTEDVTSTDGRPHDHHSQTKRRKKNKHHRFHRPKRNTDKLLHLTAEL